MSTKISSSSNLKAESPVSILYRTFWLQYRALLQEYRALLREYRALLREYMALLRIQWIQRSLPLQIRRKWRRSLSYTGLFCGNIGLFCGSIGLFCGNIWLFCGYNEYKDLFLFKFEGNVAGFFLSNIGLVNGNAGLFCGNIGLQKYRALLREYRAL